MVNRSEYQEALQACQEARLVLVEAKEAAKKAKNIGWWDLFGGGLAVSFLKRDRIATLNKALNVLKPALERAQKELGDVQQSLQTAVSNTDYDFFVDVWFDNVFTDMRVQTELGDVYDQLVALETELNRHIERLQGEI